MGRLYYYFSKDGMAILKHCFGLAEEMDNVRGTAGVLMSVIGGNVYDTFI